MAPSTRTVTLYRRNLPLDRLRPHIHCNPTSPLSADLNLPYIRLGGEIWLQQANSKAVCDGYVEVPNAGIYSRSSDPGWFLVYRSEDWE
jgi:hypothetical protein